MVRVDYRGARGANAGADFHELWALRQAFALLDQRTTLKSLVVEGLNADDEFGTDPSTWDGVDATLYFGGSTAKDAARVVVAQLKYSGSRPEQPWTLSRLTRATNKSQDNSVVARLAQTFGGLKRLRPELAHERRLQLRLVSNQPISEEVTEALARISDAGSIGTLSANGGLQRLASASQLNAEEFLLFASVLDFSECGHDSRFASEERALATIAAWTEDNAQGVLNDLLRYVRRSMLPERKGEVISQETLLAWMGYSDMEALFPCPAAIDKPLHLVRRRIVSETAQRFVAGEQRVCLHGSGGSGKTTAIAEIRELLPAGSAVLVYDCYGNGRYLDSDSFRHRPADAFLQMSNELSAHLRTPLLLTRDPYANYPRAFSKRLELGAATVAARSAEALLVVVVDAADNSIVAAQAQSPPERSFIADFKALGSLPGNVRFLITTRSGRLQSLALPSSFVMLEIEGFTREETALHVKGTWPNVSDEWIDDFHFLSSGNPRVQKYAIESADATSDRALSYLRPNGKKLEEIFKQQLGEAALRNGDPGILKSFTAGLISLPRPIPIGHLAAVVNCSSPTIQDISNDLSPGIRIRAGMVGFADEDFEAFMREEASAELATVQQRVAGHLYAKRWDDSYAAIHVAAALLAVNRGKEIISLVTDDDDLKIIVDPVVRRETKLRRLKVAMKVCRDAGDTVDAILTLLAGAEALKTDSAIRQALIANPQLAATFARDSSARAILRDASEIERHGTLLFHFLAADARSKDSVSVREGRRQLRGWLQRRYQDREDQRSGQTHPHVEPWPISIDDIASETEAILRLEGAQAAVASLRRWRPSYLALEVEAKLAAELIARGDSALLLHALETSVIDSPWDLFVLVPLAVAGEPVDFALVERSLSNLSRRGLIRPALLRDNLTARDFYPQFLDTIVTACELLFSRGGSKSLINDVLELFTSDQFRREDQLFTFQANTIDLGLRAYLLSRKISESSASVDGFLIAANAPPGDNVTERDRKKQQRLKREKAEELRNFIHPFFELYRARAEILAGSTDSSNTASELSKAVEYYSNNSYRISREHWAFYMRGRAALSVAWLMGIRGVEPLMLWRSANEMLGSQPESFSPDEARLYAAFSLRAHVREVLIKTASAKAKTIRDARQPASEKVGTLSDIARILLPISKSDAEAVFEYSMEAASEVDIDAIHKITLFAPLLENGLNRLSLQKRRFVASDLATVFEDTAVRLSNSETCHGRRSAKLLQASTSISDLRPRVDGPIRILLVSKSSCPQSWAPQ